MQRISLQGLNYGAGDIDEGTGESILRSHTLKAELEELGWYLVENKIESRGDEPYTLVRYDKLREHEREKLGKYEQIPNPQFPAYSVSNPLPQPFQFPAYPIRNFLPPPSKVRRFWQSLLFH